MKVRIARRVGVMESGILRIHRLWYMRGTACSAEGARPASLPAPESSTNRAPVEPPGRKGRLKHLPWLQNRAPVAC